jgi:hypothetical protein
MFPINNWLGVSKAVEDSGGKFETIN